MPPAFRNDVLAATPGLYGNSHRHGECSSLCDSEASQDRNLDQIEDECKGDGGRQRAGHHRKPERRHQQTQARQRRGNRNVGERRDDDPEARPRAPQPCAFAYSVERCLAAETDRNECQRSQRIDAESRHVFADHEDADAKRQQAESHRDACGRQLADAPDVGQRRGSDVVRGQRHGQEVANDHQQHHQQRGQDRLPRHKQSDGEEQHRHDLLDDRVQRVGQDSLECDATFLDCRDDADETAMPICAWRSAGASLAPSPHMPTVWPPLWKPFTSWYFASGSTPAKTAYCSGRTPLGMGPGGHTAPSSPTACATIAAVAGASPVTITVCTPSARSSVIRAAESARGGSLSAIIPASCIDAGGPAATARTRKPCVSRPVAAAAAVGDGCARSITAANAPFTIRCVAPPASTAVASDILVAGSKGTNLTSLGESAVGLWTAAARIAPSTGS